MDVCQIGKRELIRRKNMSIMNDIMTSTGWTEARDPIPITPMVLPQTTKTGYQWKAAIKGKRQEILEKRSVPENRSDSNENCQSISVPYSGQHFDQVKIVDKLRVLM